MQFNFHIRVPVVAKDLPIFDLKTAQTDSSDQPNLLPETPKCTPFPLLSEKETTARQNLNDLIKIFLEELYSIPSPVW
jgi:hypothetical protein